MKTIYCNLVQKLSLLSDVPLLAMRLVLAYGFYGPAMAKLNDISAIAEWFRGMDIPFPELNAYLATTTEVSGFVLLALGLGTRIISVPLIITMIVAIKTVHWENGFEAGNNGFEIPLYYIIMLLTLIVNGAGKVSLDAIVERIIRKNTAKKTALEMA
jgi:putative oxidoreductase